MSEGRRATLISFGAQRVSEKRTKEFGKTIRISLVLPQSNEDTCPEFNYKEELAAVKVSYNRKWSRFQGKGTPDAARKYEFPPDTAVAARKLAGNSPGASARSGATSGPPFPTSRTTAAIVWQIFESADAMFEGYYVKKVRTSAGLERGHPGHVPQPFVARFPVSGSPDASPVDRDPPLPDRSVRGAAWFSPGDPHATPPPPL